VYVLGDTMVQTMMRFSNDGDFRSNLGQGGNAAPYKLDEETLGHVKTIQSLFTFGLVGIDFIFHQGNLVFNEIEDAVGTRMLYIHTELNIVERYLDHILSVIAR
jgi:glutathione synthase/RimK-type ligase-like ATP-grasp enzyme